VVVHKDPGTWMSLGPIGYPDFSESTFYELRCISLMRGYVLAGRKTTGEIE
jgi:hypothetical protein